MGEVEEEYMGIVIQIFSPIMAYFKELSLRSDIFIRMNFIMIYFKLLPQCKA